MCQICSIASRYRQTNRRDSLLSPDNPFSSMIVRERVFPQEIQRKTAFHPSPLATKKEEK